MPAQSSGRNSRARQNRDAAAPPIVATPAGERPPSISQGAMPGRVIRAYGNFFDVQLDDEPRVLLSTVRGALKRERRGTDLVAVGDRVWASDVGEGEGRIEFIEPRVRSLARLARHSQDVEQIVLANPDQALFLFAIHHPEPHRRLLDRFLIMAESRELPALIGINKVDLTDSLDEAREFSKDYAPLYPVVFLSVKERRGLDDLTELLTGKMTAIAGPSGVGKSSLLNALMPGARIGVAEISDATGKGRHTTTGAQLYELSPGSFVADTPGIRALALQGVPLDQLDQCFPEFRPFLGECRYLDCAHLDEPGCAVIRAVEQGAISQERYDSYASLRRNDVEE
jgi:ribosome biogenesis GTPase